VTVKKRLNCSVAYSALQSCVKTTIDTKHSARVSSCLST